MLVSAGGFAVVVLLAAKFGASALSDAYFAARLIPITLVGPLSIAFNLAFVPEYIRIRKTGDERKAAQLGPLPRLDSAGFRWVVASVRNFR